MKTFQKWDYKTKTYLPYDIPNDWDICLYSEDMDKIINCAECGKEFNFGSCFTSRTIHSNFGFGYAVCKECYNQEIKTEKNDTTTS